MPFSDLFHRKSRSKINPSDENDENGQLSEKALESNSPPGHPALQDDRERPHGNGQELSPPEPVVRILRSTTNSQEMLNAPSFSSKTETSSRKAKDKQPSRFSKLDSVSPLAPTRSNTSASTRTKRLSNLLHLNRRSKPPPQLFQENLAPFPTRSETTIDEQRTEEERQAQWEKRATLLVQDTTKPVTIPPSPGPQIGPERSSYDFPRRSNENFSRPLRTSGSRKEPRPQTLSTADVPRSGSIGEAKSRSIEEQRDDDIQAAISLHEQGDLTTSTQMFGRLADPSGANNALAQVLYGLALRHGWGVDQDPDLAVQYLTHSARNASQLTSSLPSGSGSNAKAPLDLGELTIAIYELGNCHRNGWGVTKSPALAMQYFETAAELGDTDAMMEVAAGYEKGVKGWHNGKKDRFKAARWYRRAEKKGKKEVGNSWIWKDKYNEPGEEKLDRETKKA